MKSVSRWGLGRRKSEAGQSVVEVAIIVPFLLGLIVAAIEMGLVFTTYLAVVSAAREGAVFASVYPTLSDASHDTDTYGGATGNVSTTVTIWDEYIDRVKSEAFVQPAERLVANGMLNATPADFVIERPYGPTPTQLGTPITVTVHFTISSMTSGMSMPFVGRFGLPDRDHIKYSFQMPIRERAMKRT